MAKGRAALRTLEVGFVQERELSLLSSKVTSRGDLVLVRGGKMRWRLFAPDDATYWVSPQGIAYRTKDGSGTIGAAQAGGLAAVLDDLLIVVGGDLDKLKIRYDLTGRKQDDKVVLTLLPRAEKAKKVVKKLTVTLDSDGTPRRVVIEEPEGDSTTIAFGEAKKNGALDESVASAPPPPSQR